MKRNRLFIHTIHSISAHYSLQTTHLVYTILMASLHNAVAHFNVHDHRIGIWIHHYIYMMN